MVKVVKSVCIDSDLHAEAEAAGFGKGKYKWSDAMKRGVRQMIDNEPHAGYYKEKIEKLTKLVDTLAKENAELKEKS